ncbi:MAG: hypothetical protein ACK47E_07215 [Cyclobacteriaceae bacterium]
MKKMKFALLFVGLLTLGIWPAIDFSNQRLGLTIRGSELLAKPEYKTGWCRHCEEFAPILAVRMECFGSALTVCLNTECTNGTCGPGLN